MRSFTVLALIALVATTASAVPSVKRDDWSLIYDAEPISIPNSGLKDKLKDKLNSLCDKLSGGDSGSQQQIEGTNLIFTMPEADTSENCHSGVEALFAAKAPEVDSKRSPFDVLEFLFYYPIKVEQGSSSYAIEPVVVP